MTNCCHERGLPNEIYVATDTGIRLDSEAFELLLAYLSFSVTLYALKCRLMGIWHIFSLILSVTSVHTYIKVGNKVRNTLEFRTFQVFCIFDFKFPYLSTISYYLWPLAWGHPLYLKPLHIMDVSHSNRVKKAQRSKGRYDEGRVKGVIPPGLEWRLTQLDIYSGNAEGSNWQI